MSNSGFYGWHGGWAHGPRYLVPMLPFLALPMVFAPLRNWLFALAFVASLLRVVPGVIAFPYTPQVILNPLRDTVLPLMRYGYLAENGLFWLGASKVAGIWVGLGAAAVLAALTWWSARANSSMEDAGRGRPSAPSRPLIAVTLILLLGIGAATLAVETERPIRLRVLSRLSDDAGIPLPHRNVGEFLKNAP